MTLAPPSSAAIPPSVTTSSGAQASSDRRDMLAWFDLVFGGLGPTHRIELRYLIPDDETYPTFHETIGDAAAAALRASQRFNVYAGMAWRRPGKRGRKEDCTATRVLWLEYDAKHHGGDRAVPLLRLWSFGLPFSAIVWTGGGFYALLRLAEPLDLTAPGLRARVEAVNKSLARAVGDGVVLDAVHDIPRILRPVGTLNHKYGTPRLVEAMRLEPERIYTLEEVEDWLRRHHPLPPPQPQPAPQPQCRPGVARRPTPGSAALGEGLTPWEDWLAQAPPWQDTLEQDGWQLCRTRDGVEYWTRPGKEAREGPSASVGYGGTDLLHVFTSSVQGLEPNRNYDRRAYEVAMRYNGDYAAAARAKAQEGFGTLGRYAKERYGGDLRAAAKDLARQRSEAESQRRRGNCVYETIDLATGERQVRRGRIVCRRSGGGELRTTRGAQWQL